MIFNFRKETPQIRYNQECAAGCQCSCVSLRTMDLCRKVSVSIPKLSVEGIRNFRGSESEEAYRACGEISSLEGVLGRAQTSS